MTGTVAEFNFGRLLHDWEDERVSGFVEGLERVNKLAERSAGFVWRMADDDMEAAQLGPPLKDHRVASTLSVWRSAQQLHDFVYNGLHGAFLRRGSQWFEPHDGPAYVVWRIADDHRPDVTEGLSQLQRLADHGPSDDCFDFKWLTAMRKTA